MFAWAGSGSDATASGNPETAKLATVWPVLEFMTVAVDVAVEVNWEMATVSCPLVVSATASNGVAVVVAGAPILSVAKGCMADPPFPATIS